MACRARPSIGAVGSAPSNGAPASIHFINRPTSSGDTLPPPRGMSPLRITSTSRLDSPTPGCTMPVFISPAYDTI